LVVNEHAPASAANLVARFEAAWRIRNPDALAALLHPQAVLGQPLAPLLRGRADAMHTLRLVLTLMLGLTLTIDFAMQDGERVLIGIHAIGL
jgi:hypothetical protein